MDQFPLERAFMARLCLALFLVAAIALVAANAAGAGAQADGQEKLAEGPPPAGDDTMNGEQPLVPRVACATIEDPDSKKTCWKALERYFVYYQDAMDHRTSVYRWQHLSSRVIFVSVLVIVFVGLLFSYLQFRIYLRSLETTEERTSPQNGQQQNMASNVELTPQGVRVSSNVLGVIILALSLAFFYLYLVYVFPVRDSF